MKGRTHLDDMKYFRILWNRRWYALIVFILIVSGAFIYASLHQDMYKSETIVAVHHPHDSGEGFPAPSTPEERSNNLRAMISNRIFLEKIIMHFQMYGYGTSPNFTMEHAIETAQGNIGVKEISSFSTYVISFTASDPQLAKAVTRQLAQELIEIRIRLKSVTVFQTAQYLDQELRKTSELLAAQEEKLKRFRTPLLVQRREQGRDTQGPLKPSPSLEQQKEAIRREIQDLTKQYRILKQKQLEYTQMAKTVEADKKNEAVRIINEANLPAKAEFPNKRQIVLIGMGGGLLLGIVTAFGREFLAPHSYLGE